MFIRFIVAKIMLFNRTAIVVFLFHPAVKDFDGVCGVDACAVEDLLSA